MATQVSLTDGAVASAGALAIQTNGTTQAVSISTGQVATLAQNPILTSGTANGVAYLNGSKAVTSGSALTFDGTNFATTGTASATKMIPTGGSATGNGMYLPASNTLAWSNNGSETMRLDASGNLGLGVTPSAWGSSYKSLDVVSNGGSFGASSYSPFVTSNAYHNGTNWIYKGGTYGASVYSQFNGSHIWNIAGSGTAGNTISFTQAMTLDASGNLGVGTTSPSSASRVTIERNGGNLRVRSTTTRYRSDYGINSSGTTEINSYDDTGSVYMPLILDANPLIFNISATERARIDSSGNLLVGTTSASAFGHSYKFVTYSASDNLALFQQNTGSGYPCASFWNSTSSGDNLFTNFYVNASGAESNRGSIDYNRAGGLVRYNTSSDATLKNIIGDADGSKSIDILKSTRIREYSWKDDETNKPQIGVIAQELYETYKGAVSVGGDKVTVDADGNETTKYVPWAVDKTAFTFHLIAGWQAHERIIQEQQAIITQLQADVAALKGA